MNPGIVMTAFAADPMSINLPPAGMTPTAVGHSHASRPLRPAMIILLTAKAFGASNYKRKMVSNGPLCVFSELLPNSTIGASESV